MALITLPKAEAKVENDRLTRERCARFARATRSEHVCANLLCGQHAGRGHRLAPVLDGCVMGCDSELSVPVPDRRETVLAVLRDLGVVV